MGRLTDDMTRLRDDIGASRESRFAFLGQLQQDVENMQAGFRTDHAEIAQTLRAGLHGFVNAMAADVFDLQEGFRDEHAAMARRLTGELHAFSSGLSVDVTRMVEGFFNHRAEMAEKTEAGLRAFTNGLKKDVGDMRAGFRTDHAEMTRRLTDNLGDFVSALKESVSDLRVTFAADIEGAHRAWAGTSAPLRKREEAPVEKAREGAPDDLTQISGIGPGRQSRLNAAGIFTVQQLAASTPAALEAALGKMAKATDLEGWIEQAKALV